MKFANSKHYAKALVDLARESNSWDQLISDLELVNEKINESLEFKKYLSDRQIGLDKKKEALDVVFKKKLNKQAYNFVYLILSDNKLVKFASILEIAKKLNLEATDSVEVVVESAVPLSKKQEKKLLEVLSVKIKIKLVFKNVINKELIAGLRVFLGDTEIDSSLQGKILRLKNKIENYE